MADLVNKFVKLANKGDPKATQMRITEPNITRNYGIGYVNLRRSDLEQIAYKI